jgi:hypothetical protein
MHERLKNIQQDQHRRFTPMRDGLQEGFNILYGSGDSYSLAFSKLTEVIRKAHEDYVVEFIGGMQLKDDGKNKFFAVFSARLVLKDTLKAVSAIAEKKAESYPAMDKAIIDTLAGKVSEGEN